MANISDFKAQMIGGGARPNQFSVSLSFPTFVAAGAVVGQNAQFLCKAAQLPASTMGNIETFYRGRPVNFAGERTFAPWNITVYNDTTFSIRNAMEVWSDGVLNMGQTNGRVNPRDYQIDLLVHQLDRNGATVKTYKFVDAYPTNIGAITLDYETNTQIEVFDIEFTYNYWVSDTSTANASIGVGININTPIGSFPINVG